MKHSKRKKTPAAAEPVVTAVDSAGLPDAAYVERLLADAVTATPTIEPAVAESLIATDVLPAAFMPSASDVITLPAQCLLRDATEYRQRLLTQLHAPVVCIDAEAVQRIDTAFIQVLASFARSRDGAINWLSLSPAFVEATAILGLQAQLAVPGSQVA